ncbi:hypothetical protein SAY87_026821 [Trapa incisa]|uniref:Auxin-responsive protein n=1 Tax=Trapa incisa TaxID=236973 RepID=A0AAN7GYC0_9MYRT|nr:hypothetical protein SAY87_026821 [Trapa incisa]
MTGVWYSGEMNLDETELTLGLPGGEGRGKSAAKRVFSQTVDLSLGGGPVNGGGEAARKASAVTDVHEKGVSDDAASKLPEAKKQVVGWPPLRPSRVNAMIKSVKFVKVTVDGAPYGRKVDLQKHNSYEHLLAALQCMFSCFVIPCSSSPASDSA